MTGEVQLALVLVFLISWKSKKQSIVALSPCEAECMALAATTQKSLDLVQLLNKMDNEWFTLV